jgi:uncharacterized protein YrrD
MQAHAIELGWEVYSKDGKKLGKVDRLILNSQNLHLEAFVIDRKLLSKDKLVALDLIDHVDPGRVVLSLTAEEAEGLPNFVESQYVEVPDHDRLASPDLAPDAVGPGRVLNVAPPVEELAYRAGVPQAMAAPRASEPVLVNVRNIPEQDVVVSSGSDVVGVDGKKVGEVERVIFDDDGGLKGVVVKAGFLFKHEVTIPSDLVAELDDDRILLRVTADDVQD